MRSVDFQHRLVIIFRCNVGVLGVVVCFVVLNQQARGHQKRLLKELHTLFDLLFCSNRNLSH